MRLRIFRRVITMTLMVLQSISFDNYNDRMEYICFKPVGLDCNGPSIFIEEDT
jgi:hypothetical protein